jgi:hypothetical protein
MFAAQLAPGANAPQACVTAKWVEADSEFTVSGEPPVLVSVIVLAGAVVFIDCPLKSSEAGLAERTPAEAEKSNVAVTPCAALIVTWHAPVPAHAPLQPANTEPAPGVGESVTVEP